MTKKDILSVLLKENKRCYIKMSFVEHPINCRVKEVLEDVILVSVYGEDRYYNSSVENFDMILDIVHIVFIQPSPHI
jgi:hypothetical protein